MTKTPRPIDNPDPPPAPAPDVDSRGMAVWLTVGTGLLWLLFWKWAENTGGTERVLWMSGAAAACLLPGWALLLLSKQLSNADPMTALFGPMMLRLPFVIGSVLFVRLQFPDKGIADFYGWLMAFYCLTLGIESYFLSGRRSTSRR